MSSNTAIFLCGTERDANVTQALMRAFTHISSFSEFLRDHFDLDVQGEPPFSIRQIDNFSRPLDDFFSPLFFVLSDAIDDLFTAICRIRLGYFGVLSNQSPLVILSLHGADYSTEPLDKVLLSQGIFTGKPFSLDNLLNSLKGKECHEKSPSAVVERAARIKLSRSILSKMFHGEDDSICTQRYWGKSFVTIKYHASEKDIDFNIQSLQYFVRKFFWWKTLLEDLRELDQLLSPIHLDFDLKSLLAEVNLQTTKYNDFANYVASINADFLNKSDFKTIRANSQNAITIISRLNLILNKLTGLRSELKNKYEYMGAPL